MFSSARTRDETLRSSARFVTVELYLRATLAGFVLVGAGSHPKILRFFRNVKLSPITSPGNAKGFRNQIEFSRTTFRCSRALSVLYFQQWLRIKIVGTDRRKFRSKKKFEPTWIVLWRNQKSILLFISISKKSVVRASSRISISFFRFFKTLKLRFRFPFRFRCFKKRVFNC